MCYPSTVFISYLISQLTCIFFSCPIIDRRHSSFTILSTSAMSFVESDWGGITPRGKKKRRAVSTFPIVRHMRMCMSGVLHTVLASA